MMDQSIFRDISLTMGGGGANMFVTVEGSPNFTTLLSNK